MTARRVNSSRKENAAKNRQSCALETAGRAANEPSFDLEGSLADASTLSVYHVVASQSLSWRPATRCKRYMQKVLPNGKQEFRLGAANSVRGKWGLRLRSQRRAQHLGPELTHAKVESDCLRLLGLLPQPEPK